MNKRMVAIVSALALCSFLAGSAQTSTPPTKIPVTGYPATSGDGFVPGYISVDTWFMPAPQHSVGNAVWYGPWVMEGTAHWRQLDIKGYLDGVALMSPADIGETVWLKRPGGDWEGPYLVVDCAARADMYPAIYYRGEVVEVGYKTAKRWGMVTEYGNGYSVNKWRWEGVEVYVGEFAPGWWSIPADYRQWYLSQVEMTKVYQPNPRFIPPSSWDMRDGRIIGYDGFINEPTITLLSNRILFLHFLYHWRQWLR